MHTVVLITCPDEESARFISHLLLTRRLAACVNIIPNITSYFWWGKRENSIHESREVILLVKTKQGLLRELTRTVKENHQYQIPEIIALPIVGGSKEYARWMDDETKK
jgi:periplasmic divalent cation tolerance protein